jgi:hypothetical protein
MRRGILVGSVACLLVAGSVLRASQDLTKTEADSMVRKITAIIARGNAPTPASASRPLRTSFTDREVNAYFKYNPQGVVPVGVVAPKVVITEGGRVEAQATVDIEAIRKSKPRGLLDPINLLALIGSADVHVTGTLLAANGKGIFQMASADVGGIPISKTVLQMIIAHYTATAELPDGFDLDKPFDLPVGIRAVETARGSVTVVQ